MVAVAAAVGIAVPGAHGIAFVAAGIFGEIGGVENVLAMEEESFPFGWQPGM